MSTLAGEFWVCGQCRSINNAGAKQCYNCRTPKDRAAVDPATIDPSSHGQLREIELPSFRPSRGVALLASVGIVAIAIMQAYNTFIVTSLYQQTIDGVEPAPNQLEFVASVGILTLGIAALALIAWSLWLSRAVTSMPALGLGYPAADGFMAFVENFLPGLNLYRVPAIVRDVVHRLDPGTVRGEALIFVAWVGLLGGFLIPRIGAAVTGVSLQSDADTLRNQILVGIAASVAVIVGASFLLALIWWIEGRIALRRAAQVAGGTATPDAPVTPHAAPPAVAQPVVAPPAVAPMGAPDVVYTRSAFAAAGSSPAVASATPPPSAPPPDSRPPFSLPRVDAEPAAALKREPIFEPPPAPIPGTWPAPVIETTPGPVVDQEAALDVHQVTAPDAEAAAATAPEPEPERFIESLPEPVVAAEPVMAAVPESIIEPRSASTTEGESDQVAASAPTVDGPPHLTIRVTTRGMMTAEMDGETEHVILDDLEAYGSALAKVGGTATIVVTTDDSMAGLIARRAQRILEDAGAQVTVG